VARVIVDLRHNYGGEVSGVDPFVELFRDPLVDRADRLFVITGRNTFSAASLMVARLDATTSATIVGEPMGGCPTAYGNAEELQLPSSGIAIDVATQLEVGVSANDTRATIQPELPARLTVDRWRAGIDPALEAILGVQP
jgi:C-terminal processing protease CtpA/Prc